MSVIDPPQAAVEQGHDLFYDPPAALTAARRWTCHKCGHAVLRYGINEYGSAIDYPCSTPLKDVAS